MITKEYFKVYYQKNKEKIKKQHTDWIKLHPDYYKDWKNQNPDYKYNRTIITDPIKINKRRLQIKNSLQRNKLKYFLKHKQKDKTWHIGNRKSAHAHYMVKMAIKKGILKREDCELKDVYCSAGLIEAHHEDYDKPLDINWLCHSHHKKVDLGLIQLNKKP